MLEQRVGKTDTETGAKLTPCLGRSKGAVS